MRRGESPKYVFTGTDSGKSVCHIPVLGHIPVVIVIQELVALYLLIDHRCGYYQEQAECDSPFIYRIMHRGFCTNRPRPAWRAAPTASGPLTELFLLPCFVNFVNTGLLEVSYTTIPFSTNFPKWQILV